MSPISEQIHKYWNTFFLLHCPDLVLSRLTLWVLRSYRTAALIHPDAALLLLCICGLQREQVFSSTQTIIIAKHTYDQVERVTVKHILRRQRINSKSATERNTAIPLFQCIALWNDEWVMFCFSSTELLLFCDYESKCFHMLLYLMY